MFSCNLLSRIFILCVLASVWTPLQAQFLPSKSESLDSTILKQRRAIAVYLPQESEKDANARYETIYVLDGDWNAQVVVNTVAFMRQVGRMPPVIVVSVPNFIDAKGVNSRDDNFLPHVDKAGKPKPGSAADFLAFLKTELIPYVEAHHPANGTHLLHGHSYGGVFAFYALTHEPALFDGYLILDPAMWWGEHALDKTLDARLPSLPTKGKAVYVAARSGSAFKDMGADTVEAILHGKAPRELHWEMTKYADETHDSLKLKGTYDALKYAYQGYFGDEVGLDPRNGIVLRGKPVHVFQDHEFADLRYTVDGSEPNASSPAFEGTIADPEKIRIRVASHRGVFDRDVPQGLKFGEILLPATGASAKPGETWRYAYFPLDAWPDLGGAKGFKAGEEKRELDFSRAGRESFAGAVERTLDIREDGYYVLGVAAPDKVRLRISDMLVIDEDGSHGRNHFAFVVPLRKGSYPIRAEFRHSAKDANFEVAVFQSKDGASILWNNKIYSLSGTSKPK
jgi:predicted alpha/beta superfamily hydrolase